MEKSEKARIYKLKKSNDNFQAVLLLIAYVGFFFVWVNFGYLYLDFAKYGIFLATALFAGALWISYVMRWNYSLEISGQRLTISGGMFKRVKSINYTDIALVKYQRALPHKRNNGQERITIISSRGRYFFKCSSFSQQSEMRLFLNELVSGIPLHTQFDKDSKIDYINPLYQDHTVVRRNIGNKRQQRHMIWGFSLFALFLLFVLPWYIDFLNSFVLESQYYIEKDGVYFWKTRIPEADPATFTILYPFSVGKDSTHVFCRGKVVENIDVPTFRMLEHNGKLYLDKNHLYGISPRLFPPPSELWIIEDPVVDLTTLESVGDMYKDKNNLYISLLKYPYIKQIDIPAGLDLPSFRYASRKREYMDNRQTYILKKEKIFNKE